jgi:UDP-N-acetylenolpyruvoylglucosamine reductase
MATWPKHPLVLVNEHAQSTADLFEFCKKLAAAVEHKFGVTLEREPLLLP